MAKFNIIMLSLICSWQTIISTINSFVVHCVDALIVSYFMAAKQSQSNVSDLYLKLIVLNLNKLKVNKKEIPSVTILTRTYKAERLQLHAYNHENLKKVFNSLIL
jgi:hypothetical protein